MKLKIKDGKATKQAGWDSLITNKAHKPKAMDKIYQAALKKIKPKPTKISVRKLEATRPPPGWDYGVYAVYDITLADGNTVGCAIIVRTSEEGESSGNVQLDANYGGVIATKRGKDPVSVAQMLIKDTVEHLSRSGKEGSAQKVQARSEVMDYILPQKELLKLEDILGQDEQSWDLAVQVYRKIADKLQLSQSEASALGRLLGSVKHGKGWKPDLHRNNLFKAAHELGIKLPSHMF
jgi:hypothetical protein